ncbi:MAG: ABC transporter permease subunit [Clostridia bacterium]|nr:ABC transporter permease subunit [Clostridia bacterium]
MWDKLRRILQSVAVAAFWLAVWTGGCYLANRTLLLPLPYPWHVVQTLWRLMGQATFWSVVGMSLLRVVMGFALALVVGVVLAMLTTRFAAVHALFAPLLSVVRAAPVASFIFVAFLWIRAESMPTFIAFLMVVPLVWENVRQGILHTDPKLLEMARVFRLSRRDRLRHIRLPAVRPFLQAAVSTGFGFAWKAGVAAEILCWPAASIGYHIAAAKNLVETAEVFAWTAVVVALSVVLEWLLRRLVNQREVAP